MDILFVPLLSVLIGALDLYQFFLFVYVVLSWLEIFNIINRYNSFVYNIHTFLFRIIEPALFHLRRFLPQINGIDLSPLALIFIIYFVKGILAKILLKFPS